MGAKEYFLMASIVSQMRLVHKVAFGTNNCGLRAKQLSQDYPTD